MATLPHNSGDDLVTLLHGRGQRSTPQRNVILRELRRRSRHATADEIRTAVRDELPGVSTPTVYATLELFVELGLARRIDTGLGAALYDGRTEPHQHLVCRAAGESTTSTSSCIRRRCCGPRARRGSRPTVPSS